MADFFCTYKTLTLKGRGYFTNEKDRGVKVNVSRQNIFVRNTVI